MSKNIIEYHHDNLPPPKVEIGKCAYIFPEELMTREDGVIQRKYGLSKTDKIISINDNGIFETENTIYSLVAN